MIDMLVAASLFGLAAGWYGIQPVNGVEYWLACLSAILWIPVEAALIASWGTTAGKWLFHIRLTDRRGDCLPFSVSLNRAAAAIIRGFGVGIPIVAVITCIAAYRKLKGTGATTWDRQYDVVVTHGHIGVARIVGISVTLVLLFVLIGGASK